MRDGMGGTVLAGSRIVISQPPPGSALPHSLRHVVSALGGELEPAALAQIAMHSGVKGRAGLAGHAHHRGQPLRLPLAVAAAAGGGGGVVRHWHCGG